jgi:hypothetical protein
LRDFWPEEGGAEGLVTANMDGIEVDEQKQKAEKSCQKSLRARRFR